MDPMMLVLMTAALVSASQPAAGIVVSKRGGVSLEVGLARAAKVRAALGESAAGLPIEDLTSCGGKRACLRDAATQRGWSTLVLIETATILDDVLLNVVLLTVDGQERAKGAVQAREAKLAEVLPAALATPALELRALLSPSSVAAQTTPPPPESTGSATATDTSAASTSRPGRDAETVATVDGPTRPLARWIPAAAGVLVLCAGLGFTGASLSTANRLRTEVFPSPDVPTGLAMTGATFQQVGRGLLIGGSLVAVGGVVLALLWPAKAPAPVVLVSQHGVVLGLGGAFP
jgi:hypothetical protein